MSRRVALVLCALFAVFAVLSPIGIRGARGQAGSFRWIGGSFAVSGESVYRLDPLNSPVGWKKLPDGSFDLPPIPASTLVGFTGQTAITESGEGWGKVGGVWTDLGPIPGSVPTTRESWGQLKAKYTR